MSLVYLQVYELQVSNESRAVRTSRGHPEDVPEDPNLAAVTYGEEESCITINRRGCQGNDNREHIESNRVKTWLSKSDHVSLLRHLCGSRTSICTTHEAASASVHRTIIGPRPEECVRIFHVHSVEGSKVAFSGRYFENKRYVRKPSPRSRRGRKLAPSRS